MPDMFIMSNYLSQISLIPYNGGHAAQFSYKRRRSFSGSYLLYCDVQLCPLGMKDSPCEYNPNC